MAQRGFSHAVGAEAYHGLGIIAYREKTRFLCESLFKSAKVVE